MVGFACRCGQRSAPDFRSIPGLAVLAAPSNPPARSGSGASRTRSESRTGTQRQLGGSEGKWTEVVRSLRHSNLQKSGDDALDALPWVALIGEPGSGKSALIKRGGPQSSVLTRGVEGPTQNCDWWFFDKLVVLDLAGHYLYQTKESETAVNGKSY